MRANDPIYILRRNRETGESTVNERYLNAVRDWVDKGPKSIYVQDREALERRSGLRPPEELQAMASFRLGLYLHQQGHPQDAIPHFKQAQQLSPKNWNYKRQAWNLGDAQRDYGTTFQQAAQDPAQQPTYVPLELPEPA
ncbi:MAG: tetratricopeptide repeat protein [Chloroflexi bacterium]|nr:tetratricopeptide repeat protein [Chloroflexota bacterium]